MDDSENHLSIQKPQKRKLSFKEWFLILIWLIFGIIFFLIGINSNMGSVSLVYLIFGGSLSAFFYYIAVIQEYNKKIEEYNKKIEYIKFIKESDKTIFDTIEKTNVSQVSDGLDKDSLTEFQKELRHNTKTTNQVIGEKIQQEKEQILNRVSNDYIKIKEKLKENVNNGIYYSVGNLKYTSIKYESGYLLQCINRKYSDCPTGSIGHSNYCRNSQLEYRITKKEQYKYYLRTIKEYAKKDSINITEFFVSVNKGKKQETEIILPYIHKSETDIMFHEIKVYLRCSVKY